MKTQNCPLCGSKAEWKTENFIGCGSKKKKMYDCAFSYAMFSKKEWNRGIQMNQRRGNDRPF